MKRVEMFETFTTMLDDGLQTLVEECESPEFFRNDLRRAFDGCFTEIREGRSGSLAMKKYRSVVEALLSAVPPMESPMDLFNDVLESTSDGLGNSVEAWDVVNQELKKAIVVELKYFIRRVRAYYLPGGDTPNLEPTEIGNNGSYDKDVLKQSLSDAAVVIRALLIAYDELGAHVQVETLEKLKPFIRIVEREAVLSGESVEAGAIAEAIYLQNMADNIPPQNRYEYLLILFALLEGLRNGQFEPEYFERSLGQNLAAILVRIRVQLTKVMPRLYFLT